MMEEVIGRLKPHEEHLRGSGDVDEEHLLPTRVDWKARHEAKNSSWGQERGGGLGRGRGRACDKYDVKCYKCPNFGHYACPKKKEKHSLCSDDNDQHSCERGGESARPTV
jgi:hypothetical protein